METQPKIVFENLDPSDTLHQKILEEIAHLEQFHGRMTSCRIVLLHLRSTSARATSIKFGFILHFPGAATTARLPASSPRTATGSYRQPTAKFTLIATASSAGDSPPGAAVRFVGEQGEKGAQASTVHVIGKHRTI